ncbi:MAG: hypothetical protein JSV92_03350 [archaeon]|nr:MAG: hypothetical protein JSV92_03350 [archaeon]
MKIKPRAENYTLEEMNNLRIINYGLVDKVKDYLYQKRGHPLLLIGERGDGKTFGTRKATTTMLEKVA